MKRKLEDPLLVAMNIKEGKKSNTNPNRMSIRKTKCSKII
jgi:hypothetical protein